MSWTVEELNSANAMTNPMDIGKGRDYIEVNQRIKVLRVLDPMASITTELLSNENGVCIFKAIVTSSDGIVIGTGTAYEKEGSSFINKTSYIENCETSAVGRALAMCGIGIDKSIASKEEVENAKANQNKNPKTTPEQKAQDEAVTEAKKRSAVIKYINDSNMSSEDIEKLCKLYKKDKLSNLTEKDCDHYIKFLKNQGVTIYE